MRKDILSAARTVLAEAFRPTLKTRGAFDVREAADTIFRWFSAPVISVIALWVQSHIPGVRNLYPWAFPLIVANSTLTVLLFVAAVRLQLPKNRVLIRLAELRTEGYAGRNRGLSIGRSEIEDWVASYYAWNGTVREQLALVSPLDAQLWDTLGNIPQHYSGEGDIPRCLNFWHFQLTRLEELIEKLRR